jgi:16S rRNA processing protein RimM
MTTAAAARWVPLAEVMRPHGVRGEVRLRVFNRDSDLLLSLDDVLVRFPDGEEQEVSVDAARRANDAILMKLVDVDDRDRADELRGAVLCGKRSDFPALADGEFYACDVEGARVVVGEQEIGRVQRLQTYPSTDVLVVEASDGGKPWEVPLVDTIVEGVDVEAAVVRLRTLDGLERQ